MGNVLSIAAVTETLVSHLTAHIGAAQVPGARVTAVPPDSTAKLPNPGVNIYLYQATPNKALRNADLQTRAADGTLLKRPQAALDLHYLFTYYGDEGKLEQQRLLGAVTLALHAAPALDRALIKSVQSATDFLADANLDTQSELVRLTPIAFTLEELSKLWSFLLKIDYVLSAAYVASVVLIETDDALPPPALPTLATAIGARPMRLPVISRALATPDPGAPITAGSTIALIGANMAASAGSTTQVLIGGVVQAPSTLDSASITVALPTGLAAGPQTVQLLQPLLLGEPPTAHPGTGSTSSVATFVLVPTIATGAGAVKYDAGGPSMTIKLTPTAQAGQRVFLQLTPTGTAGTARLYDGGTLAVDGDAVTIPTPALAKGTYLVRVLIDGAGSPYELGADKTPTGPTVTI